MYCQECGKTVLVGRDEEHRQTVVGHEGTRPLRLSDRHLTRTSSAESLMIQALRYLCWCAKASVVE